MARQAGPSHRGVRDEYRQRYKVERSFAWLGNFRRLLIRWEHLFVVYRSFFTVAVLLVCLKRLTRVVEETAEATRVGGGHVPGTCIHGVES